MTISVIIPAFRAESFIARAVTSVLAQTRNDFEVIIISDDGQDYQATLKEAGIVDQRVVHVSTGGVGLGAARARTCGLNAAKGEIIAMLDADDELLPLYLERMVPLAMRHGLAINQVEYVDHESGRKLLNCAKPFPDGLLRLEEMLLACLHTYSPIVFDRKRITHVWNDKIPLLEDAVFLAECYNALPAVWYISHPSYRYFKRGDSVCNASGAAKRFLEAGRIILALLADGGISASNAHVGQVLKAYIQRNDALELAFEQALAAHEVADYQEFIGRNVELLHRSLV